jgi:spermidine synthase
VEYLEVPCSEGPGLRIKVKDLVYVGQSEYQKIAIYDTELYGRCLFLNDVIQCSEKEHEKYDEAILSKLKPTDQNLLVLGGGDGHTAQMALRLNPNIEITVVELDEAVIKACEAHLGQNIFNHSNVNTAIEDAIHFMEQASAASYDCVVCDLTDIPIGHSGVMCKDFHMKVFSLANRVLKHSGWISAYAGCNANITNDITLSWIHHVEKHIIHISCFGEPCFFVCSQVHNKP